MDFRKKKIEVNRFDWRVVDPIIHGKVSRTVIFVVVENRVTNGGKIFH